MGKKQINSRKGIHDGVRFASQLEISCYKLLKDAGIEFEYEGEVFDLMDEFHLDNVLFTRKGMKPLLNNGDSKVRKIYYTPDFVSDLFIIEAKGRMSQSFPLRWKMFLNLLHRTNDKRAIYMPTTKADCEIVVKDILKRFYS
tara:strand:- start:149 stop:574 length:426 start_codon:yes stop_codon:yes gene_type:complete